MTVALSAADLRFMNLVAARRFAGAEPTAVEDAALDAALAASDAPSAPGRAAQLAGALLADRVFAVAPLPTALLAVHCALWRDGLNLLAPQGVVAGMVRQLAADGDTGRVARWLEDRSVPSASG